MRSWSIALSVRGRAGGGQKPAARYYRQATRAVIGCETGLQLSVHHLIAERYLRFRDFHCEVLLFNMPKLKSHYFLEDRYL